MDDADPEPAELPPDARYLFAKWCSDVGMSIDLFDDPPPFGSHDQIVRARCNIGGQEFGVEVPIQPQTPYTVGAALDVALTTLRRDINRLGIMPTAN